MSIDPPWLGHLVELVVLALIVGIVTKLIPSGRKAPASASLPMPALHRSHESRSRGAEIIEAEAEATPSIAGH